MKTLVSTANLTRDQWLAYRHSGIGGSDAPVILGQNPWKTPLMLYQEKIQINPVQQTTSEPALWGTLLEEQIAREFSRRMQLRVRRRRAILVHDRHAFMLANVDRLVSGSSAGLEIKLSAQPINDPQDFAPMWRTQVQHYLAVTGMSCWYLAVLSQGTRLIIDRITPDPAFGRRLVEAERHFWHEHVERRIPPVAHAPDASLFNQLAVNDEQVELPATSHSLIERYQQASATEKQAAQTRSELGAQLRQQIGSARRARCGTWQLHYSPYRSRSLDMDALRQQHPDIYASFTRERQYRRLVIRS